QVVLTQHGGNLVANLFVASTWRAAPAVLSGCPIEPFSGSGQLTPPSVDQGPCHRVEAVARDTLHRLSHGPFGLFAMSGPKGDQGQTSPVVILRVVPLLRALLGRTQGELSVEGNRFWEHDHAEGRRLRRNDRRERR